MIACIEKEIEIRKDYLGHDPVETIYFGGGTPSLLGNYDLSLIFAAVTKHFRVSPEAEITLEANPDDISKAKLGSWSELGINRLSIGVQSFDDHVLKYLHRAHDSARAIHSISLARSYDFENINIDLIYGIPEQDHRRWKDDLAVISKILPEHISAYSLTIEEPTVFGQWMKKGKIKAVDEDFGLVEYRLMTETLFEIGFEQYEVSNFCMPGKESRHNTGYWKQEKYLGIGPGSHSYNGVSRQFNISNNPRYIKAVKRDKIPAEIEVLTRIDKINEYILTSLRTKWGISLEYIHSEWNIDLLETQGPYLRQLQNLNLCVIENDTLLLTSTGLLLADEITTKLIFDPPAE